MLDIIFFACNPANSKLPSKAALIVSPSPLNKSAMLLTAAEKRLTIDTQTPATTFTIAINAIAIVFTKPVSIFESPLKALLIAAPIGATAATKLLQAADAPDND